jgi:hypothetical protein
MRLETCFWGQDLTSKTGRGCEKASTRDSERQRTLGAPYLARFSRDVGFHESSPLAFRGEANSEVARIGQWNPTSRKKRARYGAPRVRGQDSSRAQRAYTSFRKLFFGSYFVFSFPFKLEPPPIRKAPRDVGNPRFRAFHARRDREPYGKSG